MISKEKSKLPSKQRGLSQNARRIIYSKININSEPKKNEVIIELLNLPKYLKYYFFYRHYSLVQYLNNIDFRDNFQKAKYNYEKQVKFFKNQISINKYLKKNRINKFEDLITKRQKNLFVLEDIKI